MAPPNPSLLEVVSDEVGSIVVGWVAPGVLYARFSGDLTAALATRYALRLRRFVNEVTSLRYFVDTSSLERSELTARSTLARFIFENRKKFDSLVSLAWAADSTSDSSSLSVEKTLSTALEDSVLLLTDAEDFLTRLMRAAPLACSIPGFPPLAGGLRLSEEVRDAVE